MARPSLNRRLPPAKQKNQREHNVTHQKTCKTYQNNISDLDLSVKTSSLPASSTSDLDLSESSSSPPLVPLA